MKDFIYINYGLQIKKIYKNVFFINDEKIQIIKLKEKKYIDELFKLANKLYYNNIMVSTFLLNKNNEYYSKKNDEYIILLKINDRDNEITYDYLKKFFNMENNLKEINLVEKWKKEIDNLELKIIKYNKEYKKIQNSINYFIGCAENAISLLSEYGYVKSNDIGHEIKFFEYNKENLNNPLYFVNINKMYDISNYIKYNFYGNSLDYEELYEIIKEINNEYEECLFFSSMLYNNYYFEMVEQILNEKIKEEKIEKLIYSINKYEELLTFCKYNMNKCKSIKLINWI